MQQLPSRYEASCATSMSYRLPISKHDVVIDTRADIEDRLKSPIAEHPKSSSTFRDLAVSIFWKATRKSSLPYE